LFYSIVHSICHLGWTFIIFSSGSIDLDEINKSANNFPFDHIPTYSELLFQTLVGLTGIMLLLIIVIMWLTSFEFIRKKYFQVFAYTHMILFPFFFFGMIAHGGNRLFNFGFPTGILILPIPLCIYFYMIFKRMYKM